MKPVHTPYDGSSHPFGIGLRPLDLDNWIEVDGQLATYLDEKKRLMASIPENVFFAEGGSEATQNEVLDLLVAHLPNRYPEIYARSDDEIKLSAHGYSVDLSSTLPALLKAAYLVQEDLVIMRRGEQGWRLGAASVCFPSSWILQEKAGKIMQDIHAPVPQFGPGTRNASMIERIFDHLQTDLPVERFNWSVYNDDALHHNDRAGEHFPDHSDGNPDYFLRVEHQTLRKLPISGDILFTIRIHIDPIDMLMQRADRRELVTAFIDTINTMTTDEMVYKGLDRGREELIERLIGVRDLP